MARIAVTGASGFVGSNIAAALELLGHDVLALSRSDRALPWPSRAVDYDDPADLADALAGADALIHCAIANDFNRLLENREFAYANYVGLTERLTRLAKAQGIPFLFISTDWVMDGTQHKALESNPGNAVNFYGFLKALGEQSVRVLYPEGGAVCRIAGVMGRHRLGDSPRAQDVGFGYFVDTLVRQLSEGQTFTVWGGPNVNQMTTPSLASEVGAQCARIIERGLAGTFHLVGDDAVGRMELALAACDAFGLDRGLILEGLPPESELFPAPVPVDSSLDNVATKAALGLAPAPLSAVLAAFRTEIETGQVAPLTR